MVYDKIIMIFKEVLDKYMQQSKIDLPNYEICNESQKKN